MSNASIPRVIRFHPHKHPRQVWLHLMLDVGWVLYLVWLIIMSIVEVEIHRVAVPEAHGCHFRELWSVAIITWWAFFDFVWAIAIGTSNTMAVRRGDPELPFMTARFGVGYSAFLVALWSFVLVNAIDLCHNPDMDSAKQFRKNSMVAWLVLMASILCIIDFLRARFVHWFDGVKWMMTGICRRKNKSD